MSCLSRNCCAANSVVSFVGVARVTESKGVASAGSTVTVQYNCRASMGRSGLSSVQTISSESGRYKDFGSAICERVIAFKVLLGAVCAHYSLGEFVSMIKVGRKISRALLLAVSPPVQ